jgi:methionyl aminopeptidase
MVLTEAEEIIQNEIEELEADDNAANEEGPASNESKKKKKKKKKKAAGSSAAMQQTEPPTVPVSKIYVNQVFPEGEIQQYKDEYNCF